MSAQSLFLPMSNYIYVKNELYSLEEKNELYSLEEKNPQL